MGKLNVKTLAKLPQGRHGDGDGLLLLVSPAGARTWVLRFTVAGKRRDMGLGGFPAVSLADARQKALEARQLAARGFDPIAERKAAAAAAAPPTPKPTFGQIADDLVAKKQAESRNEKHRYQWAQTLGNAYCGSIRDLPVDDIETEHVLEVLKEVWQAKPETASRLRGRIEAVLDAAKVQKHRSGENPARWRGHLEHLLTKRKKLTRGHRAALPYEAIPDFMAELRKREAMAALALELTILTAARTSEVLNSTFGEFDLQNRVWTIAPARMKAGKIHRVPLSDRAVEIVTKLAEANVSDYVFPGAKAGKPLNGMVMTLLLRRMGRGSITTHGFRSSFRDWCGNETHFPREIAEAALAHATGNSVEQAYRRSDALAKRMSLMQAWAQFCEPVATNNVVKIGARK
jgi:integrase